MQVPGLHSGAAPTTNRYQLHRSMQQVSYVITLKISEGRWMLDSLRLMSVAFKTEDLFATEKFQTHVRTAVSLEVPQLAAQDCKVIVTAAAAAAAIVVCCCRAAKSCCQKAIETVFVASPKRSTFPLNPKNRLLWKSR